MSGIFQADLSGPPVNPSKNLVIPLLGSQLRLIPSSVLLKIK